MADKLDSGFFDAVYCLVNDIPRGRVMTYGQIAVILGHPRAARAVGYALRACGTRAPKTPWQRVINRLGEISARSDVERPFIQRELLEKEGVVFDARHRCDLETYRWEPKHPERYLFRPDDDSLPFA